MEPKRKITAHLNQKTKKNIGLRIINDLVGWFYSYKVLPTIWWFRGTNLFISWFWESEQLIRLTFHFWSLLENPFLAFSSSGATSYTHNSVDILSQALDHRDP